MSLVNLSFSNEELHKLFQHTVDNTSLSYFAALILCMYGGVAVVYCGAMAIIDLLSTIYQQELRGCQDQHAKQAHALQLLLETQHKKVQALETELATQKQQVQTMYNTLTFASSEMDRRIQDHTQLFTEHANKFSNCVRVINYNTASVANHTEILKNILNHLHEQNRAFLTLHAQVDKHQQKLEKLDNVVEDLDDLTEQVEQSFTEVDLKLEDAIEHFNQSKETLTDKLEEHVHELYSVEEALFQRLDLFGRRFLASETPTHNNPSSTSVTESVEL